MVILGSVPLAEKALVSRLRRAARRRNANLVTGIGDDCAAIRLPAGEQALVTTDFSLEGIHFRNSDEQGMHAGRCVGQFVVRHALRWHTRANGNERTNDSDDDHQLACDNLGRS